ncbi:MAG: hypothetical protein WCF85_20385 [Rhodospirillaceae bacterium]
MNDIYLRAPDEATLTTALLNAGVLVPCENGDVIAPGCALDVIGTIYQQVGDVMEPIPGWHANLRVEGDAPAGMESVTIERPNKPWRVWA